MFTKAKPSDLLLRWIRTDAILQEMNETGATLGEIRATLENTNRPEDAALLISAMRLVSTQIFRVYQGGLAN